MTERLRTVTLDKDQLLDELVDAVLAFDEGMVASEDRLAEVCAQLADNYRLSPDEVMELIEAVRNPDPVRE